MKPVSVLLSVSLAVNAGLASVFLVNQPASFATANTLPPNSSPQTPPPAGNTPPSVTGASLTASSTEHPRATQLWARLYTENLDDLIARLKAAGFTYTQINSVIYEVGGKKFESAEEELFAQLPEVPYWKSADRSRGSEFNTKYQALSRDRYAFYRKYLSRPEILAEDPEAAEFARQRYGPLSVEKLQAINRIQNDYNELSAKIRDERDTRSSKSITVEDRQKQRLLEAEQERDIQQMLTSEEFSEYQLRSSPTAQRLREQFELLRLSETEYKALFALQRSIDEQFDVWSPDKEGQQAYLDAVKKMAPQVEAALGPGRYADYQQLTTNSPDREVNVLMSRLDLPLATAGKIAALRDASSTEAKTIRNDRMLSSADRDALLAKLASETETQLSTLLRTSRGYEAYTEIKGDWLRAIQPKPAASSP